MRASGVRGVLIYCADYKRFDTVWKSSTLGHELIRIKASFLE
jgi:hypothetical protein